MHTGNLPAVYFFIDFWAHCWIQLINHERRLGTYLSPVTLVLQVVSRLGVYFHFHWNSCKLKRVFFYSHIMCHHFYFYQPKLSRFLHGNTSKLRLGKRHCFDSTIDSCHHGSLLIVMTTIMWSNRWRHQFGGRNVVLLDVCMAGRHFALMT